MSEKSRAPSPEVVKVSTQEEKATNAQSGKTKLQATFAKKAVNSKVGTNEEESPGRNFGGGRQIYSKYSPKTFSAVQSDNCQITKDFNYGTFKIVPRLNQ